MADPRPKRRRASYLDVLDAPEHLVAEIVDGDLFLSPRPARRHTRAASALGGVLMPPFDFGSGGPGGWVIHDEPELHFGDEILVPDLGGWRVERMPADGDDAFITVAPDWICEVLSPSTERLDRSRKLRVYASVGVKHAWLVHPIYCSIEVLRLRDGNWVSIAVHVGDTVARIEPFDAIALDLSVIWREGPSRPPPARASEPAAEYQP